MKKSEALANNAKKAEHNAGLIAEGMLATTPDALLQACKDWRELSKQANDATDDTGKASGLGLDTITTVKQRVVEGLRSKARLKITQNPTWKAAEVDAFQKPYFVAITFLRTQIIRPAPE